MAITIIKQPTVLFTRSADYIEVESDAATDPNFTGAAFEYTFGLVSANKLPSADPDTYGWFWHTDKINVVFSTQPNPNPNQYPIWVQYASGAPAIDIITAIVNAAQSYPPLTKEFEVELITKDYGNGPEHVVAFTPRDPRPGVFIERNFEAGFPYGSPVYASYVEGSGNGAINNALDSAIKIVTRLFMHTRGVPDRLIAETVLLPINGRVKFQPGPLLDEVMGIDRYLTEPNLPAPPIVSNDLEAVSTDYGVPPFDNIEKYSVSFQEFNSAKNTYGQAVYTSLNNIAIRGGLGWNSFPEFGIFSSFKIKHLDFNIVERVCFFSGALNGIQTPTVQLIIRLTKFDGTLTSAIATKPVIANTLYRLYFSPKVITTNQDAAGYTLTIRIKDGVNIISEDSRHVQYLVQNNNEVRDQRYIYLLYINTFGVLDYISIDSSLTKRKEITANEYVRMLPIDSQSNEPTAGYYNHLAQDVFEFSTLPLKSQLADAWGEVCMAEFAWLNDTNGRTGNEVPISIIPDKQVVQNREDGFVVLNIKARLARKEMSYAKRLNDILGL